MRVFLVVALLSSATVMAKGGADKCESLKSCLATASKLTGKKYFYIEDLKGAVKLSKGLKLNKQNADLVLSELLNLHGYTRVKVSEDSYKVIPARDVRYNPVDLISLKSKEGVDRIPKLADYFMVSYKLEHKYNGEDISRSLRPFMSRYGRIIHNDLTGELIIQDTGLNLRRVIKLVKMMDKKLDSDTIEMIEEQKKRRHELKMSKNNCHHNNK